MPEYMTKSEPVDKKPYIVYTDEKGILYSGDPDSDIPGGGSIVRVWFVNSDDPTNTLDSLTVKDGSGETIETKIEKYVWEGTELNLKCADVQAGIPIVLNMVPSELSVAWEYPYDPTIENLQSGAYFIMPASETLAFFES